MSVISRLPFGAGVPRKKIIYDRKQIIPLTFVNGGSMTAMESNGYIIGTTNWRDDYTTRIWTTGKIDISYFKWLCVEYKSTHALYNWLEVSVATERLDNSGNITNKLYNNIYNDFIAVGLDISHIVSSYHVGIGLKMIGIVVSRIWLE